MNQRELAHALGVSLGMTNYCLRALLEKGLVKIQNFRNSGNRLAYAYLLTPAGFAAKTELTARFLKFKMAEYERLKAEIEVLQREVGTGSTREAFATNLHAGQIAVAITARVPMLIHATVCSPYSTCITVRSLGVLPTRSA